MALSIDDLLRRAVESKASDLHLKVGNHPYLRIDGVLIPLTDVPRVTPEEMLSMAFSMMTNRQKQKFKETAEFDMAYGVAGLGPLPCERFPAARQRRHGAARYPHQDSHRRRTESACGRQAASAKSSAAWSWSPAPPVPVSPPRWPP